MPPPPQHVLDLMSNLEAFLHETDSGLPPLIKAGLAHVQFETIHPFLDGNGRLGRLLITLYLCEQGILDEPLLYLSLYLKSHRATYYALLQEVREHAGGPPGAEAMVEPVLLVATKVPTGTDRGRPRRQS